MPLPTTRTGMRVVGVDKVLKNLNKEVIKIKSRTKKGMIAAGHLIQRESQKIVPREFSNLAGSAFVAWSPTGSTTTGKVNPDTPPKVAARLKSEHVSILEEEKSKLPASTTNPVVETGMTAFYAIYVHENLEAKHKEGKENKFLQKAVERNQSQILDVIRKHGIL